MCGIAGIVYRDRDRPPRGDLLRGMSTSLAHRGPDGEGFLEAPGLGLVHRRLSIIDLEGGQQPIYNEDRSVAVIFNGEIYNYRELTAGLKSRGHRFATSSDSEVLVHLYEELSDRLVERLRGMFAFALWDFSKERLLLARDRMGIKPLYIYRDSEKVVFASELQGVLCDPEIERNIDPRALESYLALGFVPTSMSILRGIEKLPAAHTVLIDRENWSRYCPRRYWQLEHYPDSSRTVEDWIECVDEKLLDAVEAHMVADVPVGAFLSGGVDSSLVVSAAAGLTEGTINTFSIGVGDGPRSELPFARQLADEVGTRHRERVVDVLDATQAEQVARAFDEPFADTSALPTLIVSRLAREELKVVLSGDGGDEGFAGYERYQHDLWEAGLRDALPSGLQRLAGWAGSWWPKADRLPRPLRAKTTLQNLGLDPGHAYANSLLIGRQPWRHWLLAAPLRSELGTYDPTSAISDTYDSTHGDTLSRMLAADVAVVLPDRFLTKVDRASMHVGLEVRPPLLDHELLEVAAKVPSDLLIKDGEGKYILKKVAEKRVPREILYRPKQGFDLPIDSWFRDGLARRFEETVVHGDKALAEWIDLGAAQRCLEHHRSRRGNHGELLWSLFTFALWCEDHLNAKS